MKLAFSLLAILLVLMVLSAIIPQQGLADSQMIDWPSALGDKYAIIENLGLDRIYYTPTFFIVLGLMGINIAFGNIRRFRAIYKTEKSLLKLRHLGSVVFHLSLLLIMGAVILNYLYKYDGVYALTEGQSVSDRPEDYFREFKGPLYGEKYGSFDLKLDAINVKEDSTADQTVVANVTLQTSSDSEVRSGAISTNRPHKYQDIEFHYGQITGYSPELIVSDSARQKLFRGFVRLAARPSDDGIIHSDFINIPERNLRIELEVLPAEPMAGPVSYKVSVAAGMETLYDGDIITGESFQVDDLTISIPRLRRWCYIDVVRSPFLNLIFIGFWTGLTGLAAGVIGRTVNARGRKK